MRNFPHAGPGPGPGPGLGSGADIPEDPGAFAAGIGLGRACVGVFQLCWDIWNFSRILRFYPRVDSMKEQAWIKQSWLGALWQKSRLGLDSQMWEFPPGDPPGSGILLHPEPSSIRGLEFQLFPIPRIQRDLWAKPSRPRRQQIPQKSPPSPKILSVGAGSRNGIPKTSKSHSVRMGTGLGEDPGWDGAESDPKILERFGSEGP